MPARPLRTTPPIPRRLAATSALVLGLLVGTASQAATGKLLLTGGVSTIEGAAGGGLTPWALVGSHAAAGQWGATAFATRVQTADYALTSAGAAFAWDDRLEFSVAQQDFDAGDSLAPLGLPGLHLKQRILGVKWRVAGEAVLDTDRWWPQVAVGAQVKQADAGALGPTLTGPLGADEQGVDVYVSATKLFLAPGLLVNATLRVTRANQTGLLGFGGAESPGSRVQPEVSLAWLPRRDLALGGEYRAKPNGLHRSVLGTGALAEDDWWDLFVAWAPSKHASLTLAWVDLGRIAPAVQPRRQTGGYVSLQLAY